MTTPTSRGCRILVRRVAPALALFAAAAALAGCARKPAAAVEQPPARVGVAPAVGDDSVMEFEDFTGRTEPYRVVEVRPQVTGAVERVYFEDGEYVNAGDPLFDLDGTWFAAQRNSAASAIGVAEGQKKVAIAQLDVNKSLLKTSDEALAKGAISKDENNKSRAEVEKANAEVEKAGAEIEKARSDLARAETTLSYTHIGAQLSGRLSRRRVDPGNIVKENETILTTIVTLDPIYVAFDIDEQTLLRLRRLITAGKIQSVRESRMAVQVGLADRDGFEFAGTLKFVENMLDQNTGTLRLRCEMNNPQVRVERGMRFRPGQLPALVGAPAAMLPEVRVTRLLSPGMFVRVRFPIGRPYRGVMIPEEAIATEQARKFVYVVRGATDTGTTEQKDEVVNGQKVKVEYAVWKGTPEPRTVTPGPQHEHAVKDRKQTYRVVGAAAEKSPAVAENDLVIVTGLQRIRKNKDGQYLDVTWLVRKDPAVAAK
jgi:RND family efflux transporter MFP subunit